MLESKSKKSPKLGLFSYPVLQAADILLYGYAAHFLLCCFHVAEPT